MSREQADWESALQSVERPQTSEQRQCFKPANQPRAPFEPGMYFLTKSSQQPKVDSISSVLKETEAPQAEVPPLKGCQLRGGAGIGPQPMWLGGGACFPDNLHPSRLFLQDPER